MQPFTEIDFICDEEYVNFHTRLFNYKVLKAVFDFVSSPIVANTKLTIIFFQEFLIKLRLEKHLAYIALEYQLQQFQMLYFCCSFFFFWLTLMDNELLSGLIATAYGKQCLNVYVAII